MYKTLSAIYCRAAGLITGKKYRIAYSFRNLPSARYNRIPLYKIQALRDIGSDVKAGDYGGIASDPNRTLSQDGDCWIYSGAVAAGEGARVYGNAKVRDSASILDSRVSGDAVVCDQARVELYSSVSENAIISGKSFLSDHEYVGGRIIYGTSEQPLKHGTLG